MPIKGFYTQGVSVLLGQAPSLDSVMDCLAEFQIAKTIDSSQGWEFSGVGAVLPYRPDVNGYVSVDVVPRQWPDHMGDPTSEPTLFGAWSMGNFGPFTYPSNLERAAQQSWHWEDGKTVPRRHGAFIRVRSSYVFGTPENAPVLPTNYDSIQELEFVTKVARALLFLPSCICYFNPAGESLQTRADIDLLIERQNASGLRPLEIWSNVRLINLADHDPWILMDTVGMSQLDVPDHEALFERDRYDCAEVSNFLRNAANYVLENGPVIQNGDTMDGPGEVMWQGVTFEKPVYDPPREVIRWLPRDEAFPPPQRFLNP